MLPDDQLYYSDNELINKIRTYCDTTDAEKQSMRESMREIACNKFDIDQTKAQFRQVIDEVWEQKPRIK
jgi:hypothetical protein